MSSQFERLNTAEELLESVWYEFVNGTIEPDLMQTAAYCQVDINRIVWKLNSIRNRASDEITHCQDCKNYSGDGMYCSWNMIAKPDGFCHHANEEPVYADD